MKKNDIRNLKMNTADELRKLLLDLSDEIDKLKTDRFLGKIKNTNIIKNKKKDMARILTFLSMKAIASSKEKGNPSLLKAAVLQQGKPEEDKGGKD